MLITEEINVVQKFVHDFQLEDEASWAFIADLFLTADRTEGALYFAQHFGEYACLRGIFLKLLAENALLASRFASLKHWHNASRLRLASDRKNENKVRMGTVSAISNFADTFLGIIHQL